MTLRVMIMARWQGGAIGVDFINHIVKCHTAVERLGPRANAHACVRFSVKDKVCKYIYLYQTSNFTDACE